MRGNRLVAPLSGALSGLVMRWSPLKQFTRRVRHEHRPRAAHAGTATRTREGRVNGPGSRAVQRHVVHHERATREIQAMIDAGTASKVGRARLMRPPISVEPPGMLIIPASISMLNRRSRERCNSFIA